MREIVDYSLDEWKEARNSIGRFDKILIDLRKYGFTIITGFMGVDSYFGFSMKESYERFD